MQPPGQRPVRVLPVIHRVVIGAGLARRLDVHPDQQPAWLDLRVVAVPSELDLGDRAVRESVLDLLVEQGLEVVGSVLVHVRLLEVR